MASASIGEQNGTIMYIESDLSCAMLSRTKLSNGIPNHRFHKMLAAHKRKEHLGTAHGTSTCTIYPTYAFWASMIIKLCYVEHTTH